MKDILIKASYLVIGLVALMFAIFFKRLEVFERALLYIIAFLAIGFGSFLIIKSLINRKKG